MSSVHEATLVQDAPGGTVIARVMDQIVTPLFIDSVWPHYWGCHRLPERSFSWRGRQLHLCARCTGLTAGVMLSMALLPIRANVVVPACIAVLVMAVDGYTQLAGWRQSTNVLRFLTGLAVGLFVLPAVLTLGGI